MPSLLPAEFRAQIRGPLRRYYFSTLCSALGTGLILSLQVIYIHRVRGLPILFATTMGAVAAVLGLLLAVPVGTAIDRFGPIKVMLSGVFIDVYGLYLFAYAHTETEFVIAVFCMTVGSSGLWGPGSTLLTRLVPEEHRQHAYGFNFMLLNLGIGFGALISASVVDLSDPRSFTHLYLGTAALSVVASLIYVTMWKHGLAAHNLDPKSRPEGGWSEVIRDRRLVRFVSISLILMICGYGSIDVGFSYFIVHYAHLKVHFVGVVFFFNTTTIVLGQLFTLRLIKGRSRSRVMAVVGVLWGVSWLMVATAPFVGKWIGLGIFCLASSVFAVGETFWQPVAPAIVNEMAPEHLRGRYNSAQGMTWGVSGAIAPVIGGLFFNYSRSVGELWPIFVAAGSVLGGLYAMTLRHVLTDREDGRGMELDEEISATSIDTAPTTNTAGLSTEIEPS